MRNSGRPKREPYQRRRRRNLVVVAFRVKIGLSSSISAGCIGAFVGVVRESLWDRFGGPPVSPAGGRTECAARDASCRRSEHASSTQCAVRPLARLDRSAATVPRTGITGGSACSAARCGSFGGYARARLSTPPSDCLLWAKNLPPTQEDFGMAAPAAEDHGGPAPPTTVALEVPSIGAGPREI